MWMQLSSGQGPVECQRFVALLVKEIMTDAEKNKISVEIISRTNGRLPETLLSALLSLEGNNLCEFAKKFNGTLKWICPSMYRPDQKRKNWFAGIRIMLPPETPAWTLDELRIDTMRSSGPGGQHVNKTSSAVRITHLPTGISVVAQEERSQHRNRALAMARLAKVFELSAEDAKNEKTKELWLQHWDLERGNEIQTYIGPEFCLSKP
ncbi:MAG: hypothetical protein RL311_696 [Bacteroidota bacterium]|jgi:peptide chain release factor